MWITIVVILITCFLVWIGTGVVEGFMDAKKRPAEPMEWCYKHGFFRKEHVLQFMDVTVCPRCYHEAFEKAERSVESHTRVEPPIRRFKFNDR